MPFTREAFFAVFAAYNRDVWPAQIVLMAVALATIAAAVTHRHRFVSLALSALFAWCAIAYHWTHFATLSPAGRLFAVLFLFGSVAFAVTHIDFMAGSRARIAIGSSFVAYALVFYPALALALGHRYPAMPTFGAPCPIAIFALGLLITAKPPLPIAVTAPPVIWAAVAASAAFHFGVLEDLGLLAAALVLVAAGIPRLTDRFATSNQ